MVKKSFVALMGATIIGSSSLLGVGTSTANAMENNPVQVQVPVQLTVETQESIAQLVPTDLEKTLVENEFESPTQLATLTLSTSSLGAGQFEKTKSSYYIKSGEKITINSCTWSPSGQKIQLGLIDATNGAQYWTSNYSGGSISSGNTFSASKTGEYYIAIGTPSTNTKSVSANGQFKLN